MARMVPSTSQPGGNEGRNGKGWGLLGLNNVPSYSPGWQPTVTYLVGLILLEMAAVILLRYYFNSVHGG